MLRKKIVDILLLLVMMWCMVRHLIFKEQKEERSGKKEFSTFQVMKILKVRRERLREWMSQGFISPMLSAKGAGTKAIFSIVDVYKVAVFKRLVDAGLNRRIAAKWIQTNPKLNNGKDVEELTYILLIEDKHGGKWFSYMGEGPWNIERDLGEIPSWDVGIFINFKDLRDEIKQGALRL
jgi:hypothetical protein